MLVQQLLPGGSMMVAKYSNPLAKADSLETRGSRDGRMEWEIKAAFFIDSPPICIYLLTFKKILSYGIVLGCDMKSTPSA